MTLLSIAQAAADEIGISRPSVVAASTAPEVQKLYRLCNKIGNRLMKMVDWQALRKELTFSAVSGEDQTGILPSDFDRFIAETFWNRTNTELVSGPVSSSEWAGLKASSYGGARKYVYRGGVVSVLPAFGGGESLAFEYVSNAWALDVDGVTYKTTFDADTDTSLLDEELLTYGVIAAFLQGEGQPFQVAAAEFNERFNMMIANDNPTAGVMVSGDIFGAGRHYNGTPTADAGSYLWGV